MWESLTPWMIGTAIAQAVGTVAIAVLTWVAIGIYKRQAATMKAERLATEDMAASMKLEREILEDQLKSQRRLSVFTYAPFIYPTWHQHDAPWSQETSYWQNLGQGPAVETKVAAREIVDGKPTRRNATMDRPSVMPGRQACVKLESGPIARCPANAVLLIHYRDFFGEVWHTSLNVNPQTGEHDPQVPAFVWNPSKWKETGSKGILHQCCDYCTQ